MSTLDSFFGTQPPPKRTKTSEEKKDSQKNYEKSKRKRSYCVDWEKDFTWLQNSDDEGMTCKTCKKYEKEGQWVEGSSNYRIEAVRKHGSSETHMKNVKKQMATSIPPSESTAEKTLLMMKKAAFNKLTLLFRNAHYIGKNNRPYTDYISLCALDKAKDLDIGDTYMTDKSCQMFIHAISSARQNEQDDIIKNSSFISVISDGSTDVSSKEAEIIYVRCSVKCRVSTLFIGVKNVAKADGNNISIAISTLLTERFQQSWKDKLIAMGTDGASVMLGKSSGVVKRISDMTSKPVHAIHCSAHRIELAYKDAIKMVKIWQRCDALMLNIYLFYKYSPLNRSNLQASFKSLDQKMLTPTRVGGTRWVPHHERALTTILHGKEAITQHLEQMQVPGESRKDSSAKARNFLKALKDKNVSFWLHFMLDVIKTLSTVSRTVQSKNSTVGDVYNELESCKTILNKYMKRVWGYTY
ncbi:zinc finger protein 862-like [Mytilus trossulus]|uniref:zinc finger protein 862-like n=1 Tax=Mytilus trossulus TaxID=6551 RepID=UPI0030062B87